MFIGIFLVFFHLFLIILLDLPDQLCLDFFQDRPPVFIAAAHGLVQIDSSFGSYFHISFLVIVS